MKKIIAAFMIFPLLIGAENEKVTPLPDPPGIAERVAESDLILHVTLLHTIVYEIGKERTAQPRFEILRILKPSILFPLTKNSRFSVSYTLKSDEWGPYYQEPAPEGEYVLFLNIRALKTKEATRYYPEMIMPNQYALEEVEITPVTVVTSLIQK